jgi:hypothetical protein
MISTPYLVSSDRNKVGEAMSTDVFGCWQTSVCERNIVDAEGRVVHVENI